MLVQPYLFFNGRAEEAAAFYQRVLGAKVDMMMRYSDSPEPAPPGMLPPGSGNKVMHMALTIGDTQVMDRTASAAARPSSRASRCR
jgi:PhnB protein